MPFSFRHVRAFALTAALTASVAHGQAAHAQIYWNFGTTTPVDVNSAPFTSIGAGTTGLTVSDLTRANNNGNTTLLTTVSVSSGYSGVSGSFNAGAAVPKTPTLNLATSTYFTFTLAAVSPLTAVNVTGVSLGTRSTATGPTNVDIYLSDDGVNFTKFATSAPGNTAAWSLDTTTVDPAYALTGYTGTTGNSVVVRIYGSGYNSASNPSTGTANWRIDDLTVHATAVSPTSTDAPEPTAIALMLAGALPLGGVIRRRKRLAA